MISQRWNQKINKFAVPGIQMIILVLIDLKVGTKKTRFSDLENRAFDVN